MAIKSNSNSNSDIEIADVENYRGDKFQVFNHQILVMEALRKANEAGSHELRSGWFNEKMDSRGNVVTAYIEDTRKKFIECVKTSICVMTCDFDDEAKTFIESCENELEESRDELLKEQWDWYSGLPPKLKMMWNGKIIKPFFNVELGWFLKYIELEVECYREILKALHSLTKRLDFYQEEEFEA